MATTKLKKITLPGDPKLTADAFTISKTTGNVTIKDDKLKKLLATELNKAKGADAKAIRITIGIDF